MDEQQEPRTYTGWKAGLVVVAITVVVFGALNLMANERRENRPRKTPPPVTTTR